MAENVHALSPSTLSLPLLLLPLEEVTVNRKPKKHKVVNVPLFSLSDNKTVKLLNQCFPDNMYNQAHCVGSSHGWLPIIDGFRAAFYIANIFSHSVTPEIVHLPPLETLPCVKRIIRDSISNNVDEYHIYDCGDHGIYRMHPDNVSRTFIRKVAMSSAPNNADNENPTVMIIHGPNDALAFCKIGDAFWTPLSVETEYLFVEILYSEKARRFYALTYCGELVAWDLHNSGFTEKISMEFEIPVYKGKENCDEEHYLVELLGGDILYVVRYYVVVAEDGSYIDPFKTPLSFPLLLPFKTLKFRMYKLNFEKETVESITSIGDSALFVGYNHSFSLSASDHPNLKPNSIYFGDTRHHTIEFDCYSYKGHDSGVYDIEARSITPIRHALKFNTMPPAPIWVFPGQ